MPQKLSIKIGKRLIGPNYPVFIIAEAGANHNGDLRLAKKLVTAAKKAGADCIKFQTFTAENFCANKVKTFTYKSQGRLVTESEFEMFKRLEFSKDQWAELMSFCKSENIIFLTTIQDPSNLEMMLDLGLQGIKVGSDDFDHVVNMSQYATTGLPLIISKGMSSLKEVDMVVKKILPLASGGLALLHCVSLYPSDAKHLNLSQISTLTKKYPNIIFGFSDHTQNTITPALAVMLGAKIIEKHFTLDCNLPGPDHWFSLNPEDMASMVLNIRYAEDSIGSGVVEPALEELNSRKIMRRRIIAREDLKYGTVLLEENVFFKRAEAGAYAGDWDQIKGKKLTVNKRFGEPIEMKDVQL